MVTEFALVTSVENDRTSILEVDTSPAMASERDLLEMVTDPRREVRERVVDRLLTLLLSAGGMGRSALLLDWATSRSAAARLTVAKILLAGLPTPGATSILRFLAEDANRAVATLATAALAASTFVG